MMDYDIEKLVGEMDFESNKFQQVGKLMLTNKEIEVLDMYDIDYHKCNNLKEVLFEIEEYIQDMDIVDDDLDAILETISERDYYQNTNK